MKPISEWTEADLQTLVGLDETSNLEFKRSESLENNDTNKNEMAKDVSAMANAAGGRIIYGMVEGKKHQAERLDDGTMQTKEWIDQILTANIEPKIAGVEITRIPLSTGKFSVVVEIPKAGSLAPHQAKPYQKYFRRYNDTVLAMLDHEIRDLMRRGSSPELYIDWEFAPGHGANQFVITGYVGNNSDEPALYAFLSLIFDPNYADPHTTMFGSWYRYDRQLRTMSDIKTVSVYERAYSVQTELPIFKGRTPRLIQFSATITPNSWGWIGYKLNCPSCNVQMIGKLFRTDHRPLPYIVDLTDKFTLT
jgi:hypothetical protein